MSSHQTRRYLLLSSLCCGLPLLAAAVPTHVAFAQSAESPAPAGKGTGLEEVTITATRRETNLQSTPIAVSALDSALIQQASPHSLSDLAAFVPGFTAAVVPANTAVSFAMRGASSTNVIVYFETPVGVLIDDFVQPSIQTQAMDTFDLDQVEVARGPQGTLFGKNTTGGVVSVHTKKPDLNLYGVETQDGYGSYGSWYTKDAVNIPIIAGALALRVVVAHNQDDGYYKENIAYGPVALPASYGGPWNGLSGKGSGASIGGQDSTNGRIKLLYQPNARFNVELQYEFLRDDSDTGASVAITPPGQGYAFVGWGFPGYTGNNPLNYAGETNRLGHPQVNADGGYVTMSYRLDAGTISSVGGVREQTSLLSYTTTGQPPVIGSNGDPLSLFDLERADQHQTAQEEVRFASDFSGPLNFVGGGFYQNDSIDFCVTQLLGAFGLNDSPYILCSNQRAYSYAGYTEGTYKITNKISLTAGARYSIDNKTWNGRQQSFAAQITGNPNTPPFYFSALGADNFSQYPAGVVTLHKSWAEPTYRTSLNYQLAPEIFSYFTYSHGYKAGGFNDQTGGSGVFGNDLHAFAQAAAPTNPEFADSYEIGAKTQFFDNRLRTNIAGYLVDYTQMQQQVNTPITVNGLPEQITRFLNAASATVDGVEAEVTALPLPDVIVRGVLSYQNAKYNSFTGDTAAQYNLATSPLNRAPEWQATLDATYVREIGQLGTLTLNGNMEFVDKNLFTLSDVSKADNGFLDARTLFNANITLSDPTDKMALRVIGRNLSNKVYMTGNYPIPGLWQFAGYGPPRYFAVEADLKF